MTLNDIQRAALVLFAAREAGADGTLEQMRAICYIIRNRVRAGWGDWLTVMEEHRNISGNEAGTELLRLEDRRLISLARDIDSIFFGHEDDEISRVCAKQDKERGPIFYWCFIHQPIREWFAKTIVQDPEHHRARGQISFMYLYE